MNGKMRLRPCSKADGEYVMRWISGERQMRMWSREQFTYPLTREQMDAYYDEMYHDQDMFGFTAVDGMGTPIGSFRMRVTDWAEETVHMGFIIVAPEIRGQGIGQRMVTEALVYACRTLGMKKITLKVFDSNPCAKKCYEKAGFREAEYKKDDYFHGGEAWGNSLMCYTVKTL